MDYVKELEVHQETASSVVLARVNGMYVVSYHSMYRNSARVFKKYETAFRIYNSWVRDYTLVP